MENLLVGPIRDPILDLIIMGIALILIATALWIYFLPTIIARGKPQFRSVLVINLLLGWTVIGWVGCLTCAIYGKWWPLPHSDRGSAVSAAEPRATPPTQDQHLAQP